jgi:uncharacterized protein
MSDSVSDESALCRACGLCCQGQLYSWVELRPEEVALAEAWPLEVVTSAAKPGFNQPCGCFQEMRCTVYPDRPQICVQYSCELLRRFRQREVSLPTALERVAQARALVAQIEARLPAGSSKRIWERVQERWDLLALKPLVASGDLSAGTLLDIVALDVFLTKHFRGPGDGGRSTEDGSKAEVDTASACDGTDRAERRDLPRAGGDS